MESHEKSQDTPYPSQYSNRESPGGKSEAWMVTSVVTLQVYSVVPIHCSLLGAEADEWHCWSLGYFDKYFVVIW
jgi:hypothetical protein